MRELPKLDSERLRLELPTVADAERAAGFYARNRAFFTPWEPTFGPDVDTPAFWSKILPGYVEEFQNGYAARLVMRKLDDLDGPIIGFCHFHQMIGGAMMAAWLGYNLDESEQGKGYMTEALTISISYIFRVLNVHRLNASYIPSNVRSARILRKLGFAVEGYARDFLFINGKWRDHILTGLVNPAHAAHGGI